MAALPDGCKQERQIRTIGQISMPREHVRTTYITDKSLLSSGLRTYDLNVIIGSY